MAPALRIALLAFVPFVPACHRQEPNQRWIHEIQLVGVESLAHRELLAGLASRETGWWPLAEKQWYEPALLDRDVKRIEAYYASNGFFRARVIGREVRTRPNGRSVDIVLQVHEGLPTQVTSVEIVGLDSLPQRIREQTTAKLPLSSGGRLDLKTYREAMQQVVGKLHHAGYAYATVAGEIRVDRDAGTARIRLRAKPGPLVYFGTTTFTGAGSIPADKLAHLVTWHKGDRYDPLEVELTRTMLFNLAVFSSIRFALPQEPTPQANVRIALAPARLRDLRLGGGLGFERQREEVHLRVQWIFRNFLGGLRTLSLQLQPALVVLPAVWRVERIGPAISSDLKLTQPDVFGTRILLYGVVGYDVGIEPGYQFHGPRTQLGVERTLLWNQLLFNLSWNLQFLEFFNIDVEAFDIASTTLGLGFRNPYRLSWLEQFMQLELRDDIIDPRAGFYGGARVEEGLPVVGQFNYFKVAPEVRGYIPLGTKRVVLALRTQFGYLRPADQQESPVTRRFYYGGPNSHRGFAYNRLSPQAFENGPGSRRVPVGGNAAFLASSDVRLRIYRFYGYWLGLSAFFDAGDVVPNFADLSFGDLHYAVGGSLEYATPVGAVRVGVGVRLNRLSELGPNGQLNPDPGQRVNFFVTLGEAY